MSATSRSVSKSTSPTPALDKASAITLRISAGTRDGTAFEHLARELNSRGIILDENPYRDVPGEAPLNDRDLCSLVRTFLVHAKSNRVARAELVTRAQTVYGLPMRARLFLNIYSAVCMQWQARLQRDGEIDFEDMLNQAADLIEAGHWENTFDVVMVDEMQDSSNARARLVQALVAKPHTYLYAVGDDWQSINRFAGADLSVMTGFEKWFGPGPTVWLQRTFRSPQSICDVAGSFVSKNRTRSPSPSAPINLSTTPHSGPSQSPPTTSTIQRSAATWKTSTRRSRPALR